MRCVRVTEALITCSIGHYDTVGNRYGNESGIENERYVDRSSNSDAKVEENGDYSVSRYSVLLMREDLAFEISTANKCERKRDKSNSRSVR